MREFLNIGVVGLGGLGVMGQRILARLGVHQRLRAVIVWDAEALAVQEPIEALLHDV